MAGLRPSRSRPGGVVEGQRRGPGRKGGRRSAGMSERGRRGCHRVRFEHAAIGQAGVSPCERRARSDDVIAVGPRPSRGPRTPSRRARSGPRSGSRDARPGPSRNSPYAGRRCPTTGDVVLEAYAARVAVSTTDVPTLAGRLTWRCSGRRYAPPASGARAHRVLLLGSLRRAAASASRRSAGRTS